MGESIYDTGADAEAGEGTRTVHSGFLLAWCGARRGVVRQGRDQNCDDILCRLGEVWFLVRKYQETFS